MKYIQLLLLLSLSCFITESSTKAADKKEQDEQISLLSRTGHAGLGVLKTGAALTQLYLGSMMVTGLPQIIENTWNRQLRVEDWRTNMLFLAAFGIMAPTHLIGSRDNADSALRSFKKAFSRKVLSHPITKPAENNKPNTSPSQTVIHRVKTGAAIAQLAAAAIALGYFIPGLIKEIRDPQSEDPKQRLMGGVGFWSIIALSALHAAWHNGQGAIQSLRKASENKKTESKEPIQNAD